MTMISKYRGKRIDNGKWVYGEKLTIGNKTIIVPSGASISITAEHNVCEGASYGFGEVSHSYEGSGSCWPVEVHPDSVGQWTGKQSVQEKDMFGGHIVNAYDGNAELVGTGEIVWLTDHCIWYIAGNIHNGLGDVLIDDYLEIIGNTTDNPELLEN